jgi:methyl-accepting chemotaxis protein
LSVSRRICTPALGQHAVGRDWDVKRLQDAVAAEPHAVPPPEHWLAELCERYTMQEQRQLGAAHATASAPAAEVEFF